MKTKTYNVYKFDELTKEQKEKAIENLRDINVNYDWWDFIEHDGSEVDLQMFDIYRGECDLHFNIHAISTARAIVKNHGEKCDTYKLSDTFIHEFLPLEKIYDEDTEGDAIENEDKMEELCEQYRKDLSQCYLKMLKAEEEYRYSDEAIIETIQANEYDFTEAGEIDYEID